MESNPSSLLYRVPKQLDRKAVMSATGLVVLEESAKHLLKETYVSECSIKSNSNVLM